MAAAVRRLMSRSDRARLDAASSLAATLGIRPTPAALQSLASLATPADGSCKAAATSITARSGLDSAALARALTNEDVARLLARECMAAAGYACPPSRPLPIRRIHQS